MVSRNLIFKNWRFGGPDLEFPLKRTIYIYSKYLHTDHIVM